MRLLALLILAQLSPRPITGPTLQEWADAKAASGDWVVTSAELAYGPLPADATANTQRRRSVLDAMLTARKTAKSSSWITLHSPDATTYFDRPLVADESRLAFLGDGRNAAWTMASYGAEARDDALLILGVRLSFSAGPFTPDHWERLDGKLDPSVPLPRWGLRTRGNAHVAHMGGCFSYTRDGWWGNSTGVTINFALDTTDAPVPTDTAIGGHCQDGKASPWFVMVQGGALKFYVGILQPDGTSRNHNASVPMPQGRGVHRYTLQHDLASGETTAIVDGIVSHPRMGNGSGAVPAGASFTPNQSCPLLIGALGGNSNNSRGDIYLGAPQDLCVIGWHVSDAPVYRPDGRRLDGRTDSDLLRYYSPGPRTVGYFPFADDPAIVAPLRDVQVKSGPAYGVGSAGSTALYLGDEHGSNWSSIGYHDVRDLKLIGSPRPWGQALALGYELYLDARDCTFSGGAHGIGGLKFGANYGIKVRDCEVSGKDAALFNDYGMWTVDRIHVPWHGRATFRLSKGMIEGTDWFAEDGGQPEYVALLTEGAILNVRKLKVDIESGDYPTKAYFSAEGGPHNPGGSGGQLKLEDCGLGLVKPDQTLIRLRSGAGSGFARIDVKSLTWVGGEDRTHLFDFAGDRWRGSISVDQPVTNPPTMPGITFAAPGTLIVQPGGAEK